MLNYLNLCVTPITLTSNGMKLSEATGFFYKHSGKIWLVSNWHVYSGRSTHTGQPRSPTGATPNGILFGVPKAVDENIGHYVWPELTLPLENSNGKNLWLQHPYGQEIDVAVLEIPNVDGVSECCINDQKDFFLAAKANSGEDVFILGYPLGIQPLGKFPIWKRASFATFPTAMAFSKPAFLLDSATREGMSGSPIIFPEKQIYNMDYGGMRVGNGRYNLSGIYSGRFETKDALGASLAVGWHASTLVEIITHNLSGDHVLKQPNSPI